MPSWLEEIIICIKFVVILKTHQNTEKPDNAVIHKLKCNWMDRAIKQGKKRLGQDAGQAGTLMQFGFELQGALCRRV